MLSHRRRCLGRKRPTHRTTRNQRRRRRAAAVLPVCSSLQQQAVARVHVRTCVRTRTHVQYTCAQNESTRSPNLADLSGALGLHPSLRREAVPILQRARRINITPRTRAHTKKHTRKRILPSALTLLLSSSPPSSSYPSSSSSSSSPEEACENPQPSPRPPTYSTLHPPPRFLPADNCTKRCSHRQAPPRRAPTRRSRARRARAFAWPSGSCESLAPAAYVLLWRGCQRRAALRMERNSGRSFWRQDFEF